MKIDSRVTRSKLRYEGNIYPSTSSGAFKVIEYINSQKILIEFVATGYSKSIELKELLKGSVRDPYHPRIHGVAYTGEGVYNTCYYRKGKKYHTPAYEVWTSKLKNCYGNAKMSHVYVGVTFCKEWLNFQNFAKWFYEQVKIYGRGGYVDKDLLLLGNKEYSPTTCTYIPPAVNSLFTGTSGNISGVHFCNTKGKWVAQIQQGDIGTNGKKRQTFLGMFTDRDSAEKAYYNAKLNHVRCVALKYQQNIPEALFFKLYTGAENYLNYYMFEKE